MAVTEEDAGLGEPTRWAFWALSLGPLLVVLALYATAVLLVYLMPARWLVRILLRANDWMLHSFRPWLTRHYPR